MVDVYVEQTLQQSLDGWIDCRMIEETVACLEVHMVRFVDAKVSRQGDKVICHFLAPDIESVRRVMRGAGVNANLIWGSVAPVRPSQGHADRKSH